MGDAIRVSGPINADGLELTIETGKLASLADGAVVLTVGDTVVLSTVATSKPREGIDFFPLTVDVEERMYAAGKIPGSFFRREGRPGEAAILTCRLTDRPLRPSFPEGFRDETQVIATIMGSDQKNPHDVISINGASAALMISGIPFNGPIGAVRMAHHEGQWIAHPTNEQGAESTLQLVVAGRRTDAGEIAVMMVEAGGTEKSWELYEGGAPKVTEDVIAEGLEAARGWIGTAIDLQQELVAAVILARGPITPKAYEPRVDYQPDVFEAVGEDVLVDLRGAVLVQVPGDLGAAGLHHHDGDVAVVELATRDDHLEGRRVAFLVGRVGVPLTVDVGDAHGADRAVERDARHHQRGRGTVDRDHVVRVHLVGTQDGGDDLDLVAEALGEARAQRAVGEATGEDRGLAGTAFTAEERTGDLAAGVHAFFVFNLQREEVNAFAHATHGGSRKDD